jgi:hypothetical protein
LKNIIKSVSVLAALTSLAFAGEESKDLKKVVEDQGIYVETAKPGIVLSGYVDAGYAYNFGGNNTVATRESVDGAAGSNFSLNAFKLALEKPLSTKNEWSAGFRTDLIYGQDANGIAANANTSANTAGSSTTSDLYVEQAYVQLRAPVGNGLDFKVGKFVTILGYEVVERPANQNITYGNLFVNMIPVDHTGILASYKFNDIVDVKAGIVDGWNNNNGTVAGATGNNDAVGFLASINVTAPGGNANIQNALYYGLNPSNNQTSNAVLGNATGTATNSPLWVYDIWGQWKPKFAGDKLSLGFNGDLGSYKTSVAGVENGTTWGGAALYAKYQFTKIFSLATRTDWIHTDDSQKFGVLGYAGQNDIYSFTATASFDVWENTLLRAEYRADYGSEQLGLNAPAGTPGLGRTHGIAHLVDLEVVYSF